MSPGPSHEQEIFTAALQLPAAERAPYLARACGADATLRQRVEALLEAHREVGDFLEQSPAAASGPALSPIAGEKPGDWIGRYKLLEQIGEGGCGVVYMAEQVEPIRRRVALKIIKPGMDTRSVIARFEAERQALALMDHPNIAKVFDAGATESGRPYFVMELVRGIKITTYCDEHALPTEERLQLFIQVCQAVQHAHQKGVIHRDLKPSNILVTTTESGAPSPVVIDFGIAKATTNQRLTDKTLFTAFEMLIGTPAYMSPEQAAVTGVDVDTRTDIYSLGVLLYELLTGHTPFDGGQLLEAGLDEIRRVIRDEEPVRPSARLSRLTRSDLTTVAGKRHAEAPTLIRAVQGDLDWIAMKSLEKDRARRYETANGLALDVQRYLADEVVSARPPSALYRLRKTVSRHKLLVGFAATLVVLLVTSLIVISTALAKERQARRETDAALRETEQEAAKSRQITAFLESMLEGAGPSVAKGRDATLLIELLDRAALRADKELAGQPYVQASLKNTIGSVYEQLGKYDQAEVLHRAALNNYRAVLGPENREVAATLVKIGAVQFDRREDAAAIDSYRRALAMQRAVLGNETMETAETMNRLASVLRTIFYSEEAMALHRDATAIRRRLLGDGGTTDERISLLRSEVAVAVNKEQFVEVETRARALLDLQREVAGSESLPVANTLVILSGSLESQGKWAETDAALAESTRIRQKLLGPNHPLVRENEVYAGMQFFNRDEFPEAAATLGGFLEVRDGEPKETDVRFLVAVRFRGIALRRQGRFAEGEALHRQALGLIRKNLGGDHPFAMMSLRDLCEALSEQKRFDEAWRTLDDWKFPEKTPAAQQAALLLTRADCLARVGRWSEALALASEGAAALPADIPAQSQFASLLAAAGDWTRFEVVARQLVDHFKARREPVEITPLLRVCLLTPSPGVDLKQVQVWQELVVAYWSESPRPVGACCLQALWRYRQRDFTGAVETARRLLATNPPRCYEAAGLALLAMAQQQLGQPAAARATLSRAVAILPPAPTPAAGVDPGDEWSLVVFARTLAGEATALIDSKQP